MGGKAAGLTRTGLTTASFVDTAVVNNTRYFYKVAAVNSGGISLLSSEASALPQAPAQIDALTLTPSTTRSGISVTGTVTLTAAASAGGATIMLTSSQSAATVPASVTVAAGAKTATFSVTTHPVTVTTSVLISAAYHSTKSATLTLLKATH